MNKKKGKQKHKSSDHILKGTLDITRSGIGYVVIADGSGDVLVRPDDINTTLQGDTVRVKITRENISNGKREGKIIEVISRRQTEFVGTLQLATNFAFFIADSDKPMPDIYIPLENIQDAKNKDKVVVRLIKWEKDDKKPVGEVLSIMKAEDENDATMKELLAENGFPLSFNDEAIEESERVPDMISKSEIKHRLDCREFLTFTIDPVDAKDFDDALSIRSLKSDLYEVGV